MILQFFWSGMASVPFPQESSPRAHSALCRAACFCHRQLVVVGYVCSVCLYILQVQPCLHHMPQIAILKCGPLSPANAALPSAALPSASWLLYPASCLEPSASCLMPSASWPISLFSCLLTQCPMPSTINIKLAASSRPPGCRPWRRSWWTAVRSDEWRREGAAQNVKRWGRISLADSAKPYLESCPGIKRSIAVSTFLQYNN